MEIQFIPANEQEEIKAKGKNIHIHYNNHL